MPPFLLPRKSSEHRIAAIALYRALLSQCRILPLADEQRAAIGNVVRNRFKQSQHVHSTNRLRLLFEAGYEGLEHLDAVVDGDQVRREYVEGLLARVPAKLKREAAVKSSRVPKDESGGGNVRAKGGSVQHDDPKDEFSGPRIQNAFLNRPLPLSSLSGARHIPVLASANHIPYLRFKKPQPQSLSSFFKRRVVQRQKRHDRRWDLEDDLMLAGWEDRWDAHVHNYLGQGQHDVLGEDDGTAADARTFHDRPGNATAHRKSRMGTGEPGWSDEVLHALHETQDAIDLEKRKNGLMAGKMQAIIDAETVLFEQEKNERRRKAREAKLERRQARRDAIGSDADDAVVANAEQVGSDKAALHQ